MEAEYMDLVIKMRTYAWSWPITFSEEKENSLKLGQLGVEKETRNSTWGSEVYLPLNTNNGGTGKSPADMLTQIHTSVLTKGDHHRTRFFLQNAPKPPFTLPECESWSGGWNKGQCFKNSVYSPKERDKGYGADCVQSNHWVKGVNRI